ncbi:hypothetical protein TrCOL_g12270 [Triparma columacea]|uniref:Uncharacterized protein n=1 Tax=Triparma columacea TaxID=722753 RepID=A0A9W7FWM3_9STRA|nr:hypothetical protein TrCOL_g12270 [Triparma columacea]
MDFSAPLLSLIPRRSLSGDDDEDSEGSSHGKDCLADGQGDFFALFACLDLRATMVIVLLIIIGMLLLCLVVEELFNHLEAKVKRSYFWSSVLHAIEKELMVLGIISFLLFMFEQAFVNDGSEEMEHIAELVEFVHLLLFFSMIVYYLFLTCVGVTCVRHLRHLREFENSLSRPYEKAMEVDLLSASAANSSCLGFLGLGRLDWEKYHFYRMKNVFINSILNRDDFDTLPPVDLSFSGFSYSEYLSSATTHLFTKMIHVGWRVWSSLIITLSVLTGIFCILMYTSPNSKDDENSLDFNTQLHRMWFPPQKKVTENNFVVDFLNIFGFLFLVVGRIVYMRINNEDFLGRLGNLSDLKVETTSSREVDGGVEGLGMNDMSSDMREGLVGGNNKKRKRPKSDTTFDPFRRCSGKRIWEDPYQALWFMKAPDLMLRVYQSQVLFFSFYASSFILTLRFANDLAWLFFVIYPVIVLFGFGYKLLPHYAAIRYVGSLALDDAIGAGGRGGTDSFAESDRH